MTGISHEKRSYRSSRIEQGAEENTQKNTVVHFGQYGNIPGGWHKY